MDKLQPTKRQVVEFKCGTKQDLWSRSILCWMTENGELNIVGDHNLEIKTVGHQHITCALAKSQNETPKRMVPYSTAELKKVCNRYLYPTDEALPERLKRLVVKMFKDEFDVPEIAKVRQALQDLHSLGQFIES